MAATVKVTKLTEHFSIAEYTVNQTGQCILNASAILHATCLEEFRRWLVDL